MRDLVNLPGTGPKWIMLDGDIDPMWIESLNTVMDDNKVLTLASNERIALTANMRMMFEIMDLRTATPATVSRAGILYINANDLGWTPFITSWIDTREQASEKTNLMILFDRYVPMFLEVIRTRFKKISPITEIAHLHMLCYLLEIMYIPENVPMDTPKEIYELYFVYCICWAFGSGLYADPVVDYRLELSKWFTSECKTIRFPSSGSIFDYYIDRESKRFVPWTEKVTEFILDPDRPLQAALVHTAETTRTRYFINELVNIRQPVLLVGPSGSGKTVLMQQTLLELPEDKYIVTNVPFNFYTTSDMLQRILEKPLEKKAGRNYGPPGSRRLVFFVDDLNMPEVDNYYTVQPTTIIRQHIEYGHWYDRYKLSLKDIHNCQYVACMNPTAGSFTITGRLQRHFCVFTVSFPNLEALNTIYSSILSQHLLNKINRFSPPVQKLQSTIVTIALALHAKVASAFLPTAIKFHYTFNLRDMANIFQGILFANGDCVKTPADLIRLYLHESSRVYRDKMVEASDQDYFNRIQIDILKKNLEEMDESLFRQPLIYFHYALGLGDAKYMPVNSWNQLSKLLKDSLTNYNEINAVMNLVLFGDAINHTVRINRILESPRGNALLVGVGGSGKQSLARLSAFISNLEVFQITLKKGYGIPDLKVDLLNMCVKAGYKNICTMFLMTDAQVASEKFLVLINDLLASGEVPDLYPDDEVENIINGVRSDVKSMGMLDTRENCWKYFVSRLRRQLNVVLCFSPVGSTLRNRSRKFPAVTNCTSIEWFHEWPEDALVSVSMTFITEIPQLPPEARNPIAKFLAFVHISVNDLSRLYLQNDRRYNYTTPKSFLEQLALYGTLLSRKYDDLSGNIQRLENGLSKLRSTSEQVADLKAILAEQEVELLQKNEAADQLIEVVGVETEKVSKEKAIADAEEEKVHAFTMEVEKKQQDCERDLEKAEPALQAAQDALNTLNKANLTELKSFGAPPSIVVNVLAAVMVLMAPRGKVPKDRSWKASKLGMAKVDQFLDDLIKYDKQNIHPDIVKAVTPYLKDPDFTPDFVRGKSLAAAGLCSWAINIVRFYEIYCDVEPKRKALDEANAELVVAQDKLAVIKTKIMKLELALGKLTSQFEQATSEKLRCQKEAESTQLTITLANRLVGGLQSENVRWAEAVSGLRQQELALPGDVLRITAFVSYAGCFSRPYRIHLMDVMIMDFLHKSKPGIPITEGLDPVTLLTDESQIAAWNNNEGLPSDRMSTENATILTQTQRWPLMIDPQLQGLKWIHQKYGKELKVIRLGAKGYLDNIEIALANGDVTLFENIEESVDAVLDHILGRNTIKKGTAIKIGDKEVEYNRKFKLILHTKLANPHYKPEMQAQCTLINFTVTREGLEDQLLAQVVRKERPDLEELKAGLTRQQNEFKIVLKELEDSLLYRLSSATGNILGDTSLVENLEHTKKTAAHIAVKVAEAKKTEIHINNSREDYRPAATRGSILYFIMNELNKINPIYQFSLKAFNVVLERSMGLAELNEDAKIRVQNLIESITYNVFQYTNRGLFEKHKIIFSGQMTFQIMLHSDEIPVVELDFLLRYPFVPNQASPVDFLTNISWGGIKALSQLEDFRGLDKDIEGSAKRWRKFVDSECPEREKFPQEWKNKTPLQRMCMMRALRPDRMTYNLLDFISDRMGTKYTEGRSMDFPKSWEECGPGTPIFFILSLGVDPLKDVEALGKKIGWTFEAQNFHNVSLGQGQEPVAEAALDKAYVAGHWVILQNIHLVQRWLPTLEKKVDAYGIGSHPDYRVYVSAEPAVDPAYHIIPQGLLENSIKITNEPPTGIKANLHKALYNFDQETLEQCSKEAEFKSILFSLCYFHAVVAERRKFGPQGWNRGYPFNVGDLTICASVLYNYLENNQRVPWVDLRYLFGEIMYGGHITDDWDRKLCRAYLEEYMKPEQLEGDLFLAPGFLCPPNLDYNGYHKYIDDTLPSESPNLYGLHPNAEIGFLTALSNNMFKTLLELQPKESGSAGEGGITREEKIKQVLDEALEKLTDPFNMFELSARVEDRPPYVVVALQECERMNILTNEIRRSLKELDLGLKGELTITAAMDNLANALFNDLVAENWEKRAYPSLMGLGSWYADLLLRVKELELWTAEFQLLPSVWLGGLFNPQSFLTSVMQTTARKSEMPLDKMCVQIDVTKKIREDFTSAPREGAFIHGLFMEGARWDLAASTINESLMKELFAIMPVIYIKAIHVDKQDNRNMYQCPVYKTRTRGPTYVWTFNLKSKERTTKWIMAGVCLLLQV
uniref:AAA+ ATPase domain-containing protein n=1 Tax=Strigamia maritima TaxID=126957 RepID=T1IH86_STRMM